MSLLEIWESIQRLGIKDFLVFSFLGTLGSLITIEIIPIIKLRPMTWLVKWLGRQMNGELIQKVDDLQKQVDRVTNNVKTIQYDNARRSAVNYRSRILTFGDEIRQGVRHSKENFEQIIEDIDCYEHYCRNHPEFKNNRAEMTTKKILEVYGQSMTENDFL